MAETTYILTYLMDIDGETSELIAHTGLTYEQAKDYRYSFQNGDFGCNIYNFRIDKEQ